MFELIIDTREHKLIELLRNDNIEFSIKQLDLGDIIYKKDNNDYIIIERKTINDLIASIKDNRMREQKRRLMDLKKSTNIKVLYLLEGRFEDGRGLPRSTIYSSIVNTIIRDDLPLFRTLNLTETKDFIIKIYKQLQTYSNNQQVINYDYLNTTDVEYATLTHSKKKENSNSHVCYINQLAQIPGISTTIASTIADSYPSIFFLIETYINLDCINDKENLLSDVMILSNNKQRRIGKILSKRVYDYLNNNYL
jgi:ERCC4-type nuclease